MMSDDLAQKRARIIMQVRGGTMTAEEGANQLGVSRKTYYEWEKKGLSALMDALEDKDVGRPQTSQEDPEKEALKKQLAEAQKELCVARESMHVRRVLDMYEAKRARDAEACAKKKQK
jgi:predicted site-specific integrase-resolvase